MAKQIRKKNSGEQKHKLKKTEVQSKLRNSELGGGSDSKTKFPYNGAPKEIESRKGKINQSDRWTKKISDRQRH